MLHYHRLDVCEREEISLGLAKGCSQRDIAVSLGRSPRFCSGAPAPLRITLRGFFARH